MARPRIPAMFPPKRPSGCPDVQEMMASAWKETLGAHALEKDWCFDEAGGDSLQLMHLLFLLEHTLGCRLAPVAIHVGLRRSEMAALLQPPRQRAHSHSGTTEVPPLFLLPGIGGYNPPLARLGTHCAGVARTVHISYPAWTTIAGEPSFDFHSLIADVVRQVKSQSPAGPVLLAGYSFGGVVAFAVAATLARIGYSVRFLGLLDSDARPAVPNAVPLPRLARPRRICRALSNRMTAIQRGTAAEMAAGLLATRLISPPHKRVLRFMARIPRIWLPIKFGVYLSHELVINLYQPLLHHWTALADTLSPLEASAVLFRTDDHSAAAPPDLGWKRLCPKLSIVSVPGSHLDMLQMPNLAALSAAFIRAIAEAVDDGSLESARARVSG
jgi:thioesterase domain-containing protein